MNPRSITTACLTRTAITLAVLTGQGATATPASAQSGACCRPGANCAQLTQADCTSAGGFFSLGSPCSPVICAVVTACCLPDGSCSFQPTQQCAAAGGVFNDPGSTCANTNCNGGAGGGGTGCGTCGVGLPAVLLAVPAYLAARRRRAGRCRRD